MSQPPQPWEFRSKPAWQRLIIMTGGVILNVFLAFVIYAMILYTWGQRKMPMSGITYGVEVTDSLMYQIGFRNGDKIVSIKGEPVVYFDDIPSKILMAGGEKVALIRNGAQENLTLPDALIGKLVERKKNSLVLFVPRIPMIVDVVPDTSNAHKAGLKRFDQIVAVDGIATPFYEEYKKAIDAHKGQEVALTVERKGAVDTLHALVKSNGTLGFLRLVDPDILDSLGLIKIEKTEYSFLSSFPAGVRLATEKLSSYIDNFKQIFSPKTEAYKGVGGFKGMASVFPKMWDWLSFWSITAFFSIALAFFNILPIPALDGGHVLFTLLEMVTGRKPSQKLLEYAQVVGMVLLLGLMLYVNGNDWFGWGKGR